MVWHTTSPVYCTHLTLGNFKTLKITHSAVKEHLFENKQSYLCFICPQLLLVTCARNKYSKCCPSACTHALSCFLHSLMVASITFCCRLFQTSMRRSFSSSTLFIWHSYTLCCITRYHQRFYNPLVCGPMPNVMVALPNIGSALCPTPQTLADARY